MNCARRDKANRKQAALEIGYHHYRGFPRCWPGGRRAFGDCGEEKVVGCVQRDGEEKDCFCRRRRTVRDWDGLITIGSLVARANQTEELFSLTRSLARCDLELRT